MKMKETPTFAARVMDRIALPKSPPSIAEKGEKRDERPHTDGADIFEVLQKVQDLSNRSHAELWQALELAYGVALVLRDAPDLWLEFCGRERWPRIGRRPRAEEREDALHHVLRYADGRTGVAATKQVSKFMGALGPLFKSRAPAIGIAKILEKHGGYEGLYADNRIASGTVKPKKKLDRNRRLLVSNPKFGAHLDAVNLQEDVRLLVRRCAPNDFRILKVKPQKKKA